MKCVIFDSGAGRRMGEFTRSHPKCMAPLGDGETVLHRQLRILTGEGIRDVVVTTGPFEEQIRATAAGFPGTRFAFVRNPDHERTNCVYSMFLAKGHFDDEMLVLHGDLVFDRGLVRDLLAFPHPSAATVDFGRPLPEKDFKARIRDGRVTEISVGMSGADCRAFQPFYRLDRATAGAWAERAGALVARGEVGRYAEDALNEILPVVDVRAFDCGGHYVDEIDNEQDHARVAREIAPFDLAEE